MYVAIKYNMVIRPEVSEETEKKLDDAVGEITKAPVEALSHDTKLDLLLDEYEKVKPDYLKTR